MFFQMLILLVRFWTNVTLEGFFSGMNAQVDDEQTFRRERFVATGGCLVRTLDGFLRSVRFEMSMKVRLQNKLFVARVTGKLI